MSAPIIPGMHSLNLVSLSIFCPLLASPAAAFTIGAAWGDDGGVTIAPAEQDAEMVIGAGGFPTFVMSNNPLLLATVKITPTSTAHRKLGQLYRDWFAALRLGGQFLPISFSMIDRANGDIVTDPGAALLEPAILSKLKAKSDGDWIFALPNGKKLQEFGTKNLVGP